MAGCKAYQILHIIFEINTGAVAVTVKPFKSVRLTAVFPIFSNVTGLILKRFRLRKYVSKYINPELGNSILEFIIQYTLLFKASPEEVSFDTVLINF